MPDQQRCCILGVCCIPFSAEQETALAEYIFEAMAEDESFARMPVEESGLRTACRAAARKLIAERLIAQAV
jgi:hypothetical protein